MFFLGKLMKKCLFESIFVLPVLQGLIKNNRLSATEKSRGTHQQWVITGLCHVFTHVHSCSPRVCFWHLSSHTRRERVKTST